ncbi:MAG: hypothetical protein S4CHLAM37_11360 [Chlamydiia bacterium]|nr:hypothetical protein [Chlamydiia bacterium]
MSILFGNSLMQRSARLALSDTLTDFTPRLLHEPLFACVNTVNNAINERTNSVALKALCWTAILATVGGSLGATYFTASALYTGAGYSGSLLTNVTCGAIGLPGALIAGAEAAHAVGFLFGIVLSSIVHNSGLSVEAIRNSYRLYNADTIAGIDDPQEFLDTPFFELAIGMS